MQLKGMVFWSMLLAAVIAVSAGPAFSAEGGKDSAPGRAESTGSAQDKEFEAAAKAATTALKKGPVDISFAEQATLHVPKDFGFIPAQEAKKLLEAMGNRVGDDLLGMVITTDESKGGWFVAATFEKSGYVKDDDARNWKAEELLDSIKKGTEETNKMRREKGIPETEVTGWVEKPAYDQATHRLVWSLASKLKSRPVEKGEGVNYNTLALGREGYISMNLVTDRSKIEELKPVVKNLLAALEFNQGKRYEDFNASTDNVAAYGLGAIVAGVAAKKIGFFALAAGILAKFSKVFIAAAVAGTGVFAKIFKRKKNADPGSSNP